MADLLTALTRTLDGRAEFAVVGAFLWGVASILLSPCHVASVPLVVAYTGRSTTLSPRRAAALSALFASGLLVTVAVIGALSVLAGRMLGSVGGVTNYLVAALLFVVGLDLLGAWPFQWTGLPRPETTRRGLGGAFLFGLAFGTALGPVHLCVPGSSHGRDDADGRDATSLRRPLDDGIRRGSLRGTCSRGRRWSAAVPDR